MRPVSMDPYRERMAAFDELSSRIRLSRDRPFPTDWARVLNGVGLASFTMRVERVLNELSGLSDLKPTYLHATGTAASIGAELRTLLGIADQFMPALPSEPRAYFNDLRGLVADAVELTEAWWAVG